MISNVILSFELIFNVSKQNNANLFYSTLSHLSFTPIMFLIKLGLTLERFKSTSTELAFDICYLSQLQIILTILHRRHFL